MFVHSSLFFHKRIQKVLILTAAICISLIILSLAFQKQTSKILFFKYCNYPSAYYSGSDRDSKDESKMNFIKGMILHAYNGYKEYAWGSDEVNPISETAYNWYSNATFLMTPVDMLDTLYIIGAKKEFEEAKKLILTNMTFNQPVTINAFDINIRIIGGLLSAYELSGDIHLFNKARELADKMMVIFDTKSGLPFNNVILNSNIKPSDEHRNINLAEAGTFILEWQYLSDISGDPIYAKKVF